MMTRQRLRKVIVSEDGYSLEVNVGGRVGTLNLPFSIWDLVDSAQDEIRRREPCKDTKTLHGDKQ